MLTNHNIHNLKTTLFQNITNVPTVSENIDSTRINSFSWHDLFLAQVRSQIFQVPTFDIPLAGTFWSILKTAQFLALTKPCKFDNNIPYDVCYQCQ